MILSSLMTWQCCPLPPALFWNPFASQAPLTPLASMFTGNCIPMSPCGGPADCYQSAQVSTSLQEKPIDTQILLVIVVVRLVEDVEDAFPEFLPEALPFSRAGKVYQACAVTLKAATAARVALEQKKKMLLMEGKREEAEQLVDSISAQAHEYTCQAVQSLRAMKDAHESLPSEHESQIAAADITNQLYHLAVSSTCTLE